MAEPSGPDLAHRISSLFQAAFTEIGLFVVVFITLAGATEAELWWGTAVFLGFYMLFLGAAAWKLMQLHSLKPRTPEQTVRAYHSAWFCFVAANVTILLCFVAWFFRMLWVYAWSR